MIDAAAAYAIIIADYTITMPAAAANVDI